MKYLALYEGFLENFRRQEKEIAHREDEIVQQKANWKAEFVRVWSLVYNFIKDRGELVPGLDFYNFKLSQPLTLPSTNGETTIHYLQIEDGTTDIYLAQTPEPNGSYDFSVDFEELDEVEVLAAVYEVLQAQYPEYFEGSEMGFFVKA